MTGSLACARSPAPTTFPTRYTLLAGFSPNLDILSSFLSRKGEGEVPPPPPGGQSHSRFAPDFWRDLNTSSIFHEAVLRVTSVQVNAANALVYADCARFAVAAVQGQRGAGRFYSLILLKFQPHEPHLMVSWYSRISRPWHKPHQRNCVSWGTGCSAHPHPSNVFSETLGHGREGSVKRETSVAAQPQASGCDSDGPYSSFRTRGQPLLPTT